jgi:hypothetical protein
MGSDFQHSIWSLLIVFVFYSPLGFVLALLALLMFALLMRAILRRNVKSFDDEP